MIGTLDSSRKEATVVGAGIAGMLAAYALDKNGYRVTLIEERQRGGGLISTRKTEHGIAESAAHSLIATRAVRELCAELNVELIEPRKESRAKFIMRDGRLCRFPLRIKEAAGALRRAAFAQSKDGETQNLDAWTRRHLGSAALNYLLTPFVRGIYGVQPAELGVAAAYPALRIPAGKTLLGSMLNKKWNQTAATSTKDTKQRVAPQLGMGELVSQLERRLSRKLGSRFRRDETVRAIPDAANVIIATPAYAAAKIVKDVEPGLAAKLLSVNYTPIVSVTVFVERSALTRPVRGTGVLMPACEDRKSLGILFNSSSFDYRVCDDSRFASFTIMMGGTAQPEWLKADDDEILQAIKLELSEVLEIRQPAAGLIHRWPAALPQYAPELPTVWQHARETWCATPGRILFGNYTGQISLRGMIERAAAFGQ